MAAEDLYGGFSLDDDAFGGVSGAVAAAGLQYGLGSLPTQAPPSANPSMAPIRGAFSGSGVRMTTGRMPTGMRGTTGMIGTASGAGGGGDGPRPMTSVKAAGYQSKPGTSSGHAFDPLNSRAMGPAPPLAEKEEGSAADKASEMERKVHGLLEASASAARAGDVVLALERAKEAGKKERALVRHREKNSLEDQMNTDLTFCVFFSLAEAYELNGMHNEALNTYELIAKNKEYLHRGRVRINMGNIHFNLQQFAQAIKQYKMAVDQIQGTNKHMRLRVLRNIGAAQFRMGKYADAIESLEAVVEQLEGEEDFDHVAAFNLLVCYFAKGDVESLRTAFQKLVALPPPLTDADGNPIPVHGGASSSSSSSSSSADDDDEHPVDLAARKDALFEYLRDKQKEATRLITTAARLIAPHLSVDSWEEGYDWVVEQLRHDHSQIASELLIAKALEHMQRKEFDRAIEQLKAFERKDQHLKARAATNLAFLYLLERDVEQAHRYASLAVKHDRYNAKALVNLGICLSEREELERAKELFLEAIGVEADCVEAIFNLGLVNRILGIYAEAIQAFEKLHTLVPTSAEVLYQLATLYDAIGNAEQAVKYFNYLLARVPTDSEALYRLGCLYGKHGDEAQAIHYQQESYRFFPVNLEALTYLGIAFVKSEMYEKAMTYFERAAEIQPKDVKWHLMVASCLRRLNSPERVEAAYREIHEKFPDNIEALTYLIAIREENGATLAELEPLRDELIQLERRSASNNPASFGAASTGYDGSAAPAGYGGGGGSDYDSSPRGRFGADGGGGDGGGGGGGGGGFLGDDDDDFGSPGGSAPVRSRAEGFAAGGDDGDMSGNGGRLVVGRAGAGAPAGSVRGMGGNSSGGGGGGEARFAAPSQTGAASSSAAGRPVQSIGRGDEDEFADADLSGLLQD